MYTGFNFINCMGSEGISAISSTATGSMFGSWGTFFGVVVGGSLDLDFLVYFLFGFTTGISGYTGGLSCTGGAGGHS